jgi:cytochrome b pre-mRNA-processing protein 3
MFINRLFGRRSNIKLAAHKLYKALVDQARHPVFYRERGVPDSLDGRFDMIVLHLFLCLHRLRDEQNLDAALTGLDLDLQTKLQEILFSDMDQGLRELGVGDLGVGKRIRDMAQAFFGRMAAYEEAMALEAPRKEAAEAALRQAIERNVYRGGAPGQEQAEWMAAYMQKQRVHLAAQPFSDLIAGRITFAAV